MNGISVDMNHLKKGEVNLGTSIMAVVFDGGVILGADSRTTTGSFIANRVTDKLTKVHDKIWCCTFFNRNSPLINTDRIYRSGSAADTQAVADIVKYHLSLYSAQNNRAPTPQIASAVFQELCYNNKDNLTAGIIVAGFNESTGAGEVYSVPLGGSIHQAEYAIAGSGSSYIYGYCDQKFKSGMTKEEAIQFVKTSLAEAIKWDGSSGGVIRMAILTAGPTERHVFYPEEYRSEYVNHY
ncbi:uncharacterized protein SAPINGB_P000318 [Magnusiomyces paraingens]|uniref:proteasome endopeptidase complex n=1 Tax=Magnusiomyces paraingens TaxID=2606893 RepID=A0A5E8AY70_9ASCO|nr:uncharacterized protein SAPINGB_P000318 [Saprochaete ingens]VVT44143.1 unnamed protein product [Saprochaete ingens]